MITRARGRIFDTLNTSNVNPVGFGKLFTRVVDDEIYAQPLYISGVSIPNVGVRNVLYVGTVNNTVYAFDADKPDAGEPLWKVSLTDTVPGVTPVSARDVGQNCGTYRNISEHIGIVGTPVIDSERQTIYLVARTKEHDQFVQRLHALDIATGAPRPNSPVVVKASARGPRRFMERRTPFRSTDPKSTSGVIARQRAYLCCLGLSLRYGPLPWMDHGL